MKQQRKQDAKALRRAIGRQDWGGVKPVTKVVPDKKKEVVMRKRKHKGRKHDPYFVSGRPLPLEEIREHLERLELTRLRAAGLLEQAVIAERKTTSLVLEPRRD